MPKPTKKYEEEVDTICKKVVESLNIIPQPSDEELAKELLELAKKLHLKLRLH